MVVSRSDVATESEDPAEMLEARELSASTVFSAPLVRKGAELYVSWPGAASYPWAQFVAQTKGTSGDDLNDGLRGLRRLILAFRSHSKGRLARFQDKIEHARMTKGTLGVEIRQRLMRDDILSLENVVFLGFCRPRTSCRRDLSGPKCSSALMPRFARTYRRFRRRNSRSGTRDVDTSDHRSGR
jgi:hypothetical protein